MKKLQVLIEVVALSLSFKELPVLKAAIDTHREQN